MRNLSRSTRYHNTVEIDDAEQNRLLINRLFFLMRDAAPKIDLWTKTDESIIVSAQHDGYRRLDGDIIHRRTLSARPAAHEIHLRDIFTGDKRRRHSFSLKFITPILDIRRIDRCSLEILGGKTRGLYLRGSEEGLENLIISPIDYFPRYGVKAPAMLISFIFSSGLPFEISTAIGPIKQEIISGEIAEKIGAAV
jgi:uncharacterized heparinase superfamily protein